jgi:hypothetical protein
MEKRKFSINDSIKSGYPFIKGVNENAECTLCNGLKIETVKALTIVKTHFKDFSCLEFFSQISQEKVLLEQVHKSDKHSGEFGKAFAE